jgi:hypothetical protein
VLADRRRGDPQPSAEFCGGPAEPQGTPQTIGWFYNQIARAICRLDRTEELFTGDPARQVSWPDAPGVLYRVTDRRSALLAILQIIEQGEGSPHDLDNDRLADADELGHYYRFEEIVRGRQLVKGLGGRWLYEGPEIPFEPDGVYPVIDDPDSYRLPAGSTARRESQLCDQSYTNLLTALHRVFNGHPQDIRQGRGPRRRAHRRRVGSGRAGTDAAGGERGGVNSHIRRGRRPRLRGPDAAPGASPPRQPDEP